MIIAIEDPSRRLDGHNNHDYMTNITAIGGLFPRSYDQDPAIHDPDPNCQDPQIHLRSWTQPIIEHVQNGIIPKEEKSDKAFKMRISHFVMIHGVLYKKSMTGPYLRSRIHGSPKDIH